jgi:hypothetical protein
LKANWDSQIRFAPDQVSGRLRQIKVAGSRLVKVLVMEVIMSQFAHRAIVWSVVILLLLIGIFLQIRSARGAETAEPLMVLGQLPYFLRS